MSAKLRFAPFAALLFTAACSSESPQADHTVQTETPQETTAPTAITPAGPQCFLKALNRDSTHVRLEFDGDSVHGTMERIPWEKDGARGTLAGIRTANGEMDLLYRYVIEGSNQTEAQMMKLDGNRLLIKVGELEDPANDGNLRYKDVSKASYSEELQAIPCP